MRGFLVKRKIAKRIQKDKERASKKNFMQLKGILNGFLNFSGSIT